MKTLQPLQDLNETLSKRERRTITLAFKVKGKQHEISADHDGFFQTVKFTTPRGSVTVPARELKLWLNMFFDADPTTVRVSR